MTCSFHKFGDYFPGTGDLKDKGKGAGKGYAVNFPFKDGIEDDSYRSVFRPVRSRLRLVGGRRADVGVPLQTIQAIMEWYRPGAIVLQCGADSLAEDKLGVFNLSMRGPSSPPSLLLFLTSLNRSRRLRQVRQDVQHPLHPRRRRRLHGPERREDVGVRDGRRMRRGLGGGATVQRLHRVVRTRVQARRAEQQHGEPQLARVPPEDFVRAAFFISRWWTDALGWAGRRC